MADLDAPLSMPARVDAVMRRYLPLVADAATEVEKASLRRDAWREMGLSDEEITELETGTDHG